MGRPSLYTPEVADSICERLAEGESLRSICRDEAMPALSSVFKWLNLHAEFADQYTRAREEQAEALADEIVGIADNDCMEVEDSAVLTARDRLRVEARKWVASKLKPKKYGDRQVLAGDPDAPLSNVTDQQLDERLNALLSKALDANPAGG
jgi:hypothetical protein